jgi:hypothetical protein
MHAIHREYEVSEVPFIRIAIFANIGLYKGLFWKLN